MLTFFHGWRRKSGVATLVMASVFAALWVRGLASADILEAVVGKTNIEITSGSSRIALLESVDDGTGAWRHYRWGSDSPESDTQLFRDRTTTWIVRRWGFVFGINRDHDFYVRRIAIIPYWSIVIPLTLLSAYLLLSKPRPKNQTDVAQNPANISDPQ